MTPTEAKLLEPLKEEIVKLFAVQSAFPTFGPALIEVLMSSAIKSIALAVVTGERTCEQIPDFRSQQLEHLFAVISQVYTEELKYLDDNPKFVEKVLSDGGVLKDLVSRIGKKAN